MLYCDNHRTGLFLFVYFKIYLVQNHSRKKPLSRENGRLCFRDEQGLNLITAKFRKGKETAPLSLITDARWTKVHMHYAWGNLKKLYEKFKLWLFVIALKKKFKKNPVTTSNNIYLPVIPVLCIQKNSYIFFTLSSKSSIWKAIKRYPQIFVCERLDFLISVADRYEATSHRGKEKTRKNKSSQPSVRHFTA